MVLDTVLYSPDKPQFCITTDEETPQKLVIPAEFLTEHVIGDLPSLVFLRVPGGATWPVEVLSENKIVSFDKGWNEFAQHFSLQSGGRIVVFQYVSYGSFSVFIFDRSVEIKYPSFTIIHEDEDEEESEIEIEIERETSIEILDEPPSHLRQYANPCSGSKRPMTNPSTMETGGLNYQQGTEASNRKALAEKGQGIFAAQGKMKARSLKNMNASRGLQKRKASSQAEKERCGNYAAREKMKASGSKAKSETLKRARKQENNKEFGDKANCSYSAAPTRPIAEYSKKVDSSGYLIKPPFFMVPIVPSSMRKKLVIIPAEFARIHMTRRKIYATLGVNGRSWIVTYYYQINKRRSSIFSKGWHNFSVDNNLEVGDVCIFDLVDRTTFKFEVSILRDKSG